MNSESIYLGIDPGVSGAAALISGKSVVAIIDFTNPQETYGNLFAISDLVTIRGAGLERVGAAPGQGGRSIFTFGENYGWWQGVLIALGIPYQLVNPLQWQKNLVSKKKNKNDRPQLPVARRLFPKAELHLKKHHDRASALMIAYYVQRFEENML